MRWFNGWGLLWIATIMLPNIVFALTHKDGFENLWQNRAVEVLEQIGRFGCFILMIFQIPGTFFGWHSQQAFYLYLVADTLLAAAYCLIWLICFHKSSMFRALALSIIPSVLFLLSGVLIRSIPLIAAAALFAPSHILISYKNAK